VRAAVRQVLGDYSWATRPADPKGA
jgi:hypothetical protein